VNEQVAIWCSASKVDHARLHDISDTEKLTNMIIEEGKIVQYSIRLSFSLDFYWLFVFFFFFLLFFFLSLSPPFSLSSELCTTKKNDNAQLLWERRIRSRRRRRGITAQYGHTYVHQMVKAKKESGEFFFSFLTLLSVFLTLLPARVWERKSIYARITLPCTREIIK
jgi:hypothetical protein